MKKPDNSKDIDCFQCRHFYITWEVNQPRGCKAFGFKTKQLPSIVVLEASGAPCLKFSPKAPPNPKKPKPKKGWVV